MGRGGSPRPLVWPPGAVFRSARAHRSRPHAPAVSARRAWPGSSTLLGSASRRGARQLREADHRFPAHRTGRWGRGRGLHDRGRLPVQQRMNAVPLLLRRGTEPAVVAHHVKGFASRGRRVESVWAGHAGGSAARTLPCLPSHIAHRPMFTGLTRRRQSRRVMVQLSNARSMSR